MKKFLSLVLALVMTMSLVTVSAGAKDFTDDSKISYAEAVDVISTIDVVDGYKDGTFNPSATLTRGAAAKIICNLILGPTTASALSADTAPFKDVPVNHEFAGYIAYCAQQEIITGYGDGSFRPAGTLTGYAFMKMLLGALGYNAEMEGYVGPNWSVQVGKQALGIGLDDGNDEFVGVKAVTREEACLYAFNALTADMVEYDSKVSVNVNGATVVVGGSKAHPVLNSSSDDYIVGSSNDSILQFCEKYFPKLKQLVNDGEDDFGRPGNTWKFKTDKIGTYAKDADVVYTQDVKAKDAYKDLDLSDPYHFDVVVDGKDQSSEFVATKTGSGKDDKVKDVIDADAFVGNGAQYEFFKGEDDRDQGVLTVINNYLLQVDGEYDKEDEELNLETVTGTKMPGGDSGDFTSLTLKSDDFDNLDSYADGDYVLVTAAYDGTNYDIKTIAKAEKVTAAVTEYVDNDTVTAGGTEYKYAAANDQTDYQYELKAEYDLYLDANGYVIFTDGVEDESKYVFIDGFDATSSLTNAKIKAYGYFLDGTDDEITVNKINGSKVNGDDLRSGSVNGVAANQWFRYTEKDGKYDLNEVSGAVTGTATAGLVVTNYDDQGTQINGVNLRGNKDTKFVVVKANGDVKVYTGIKNVPDTRLGTSSDRGVYAVRDNGYAKYVFINVGNDGTVSGGSASSDVVYLLKADKLGTDADDNEYYRYKAIVNGKEQSVKLDSSVQVALGLYTDIEYNENGYIDVSAWTRVDPTDGTPDWDTGDFEGYTASGATVTQKGKTVTFSSLYNAKEGTVSNRGFYLADGAKIFMFDDGSDKVDVASASKLAREYKVTGLTGMVYGVINADGEYSTLFVVD